MAETTAEAVGFLPVTISHILIILTLLLAGVAVVMASIGAVFAFRNSKDGIERLENDIEDLREEIEQLKSRPATIVAPVAPPPEPEPEPEELPEEELEPVVEESAPVPEPAPEPETEMSLDELLNSAPIWQDMLNDYHALRDAFDPEKGQGLVEPFVAAYGMELLVSHAHEKLDNGKIMPRFEKVQDVVEASYWAWPITGQAGDYAVVPSPMVPYDQKLQDEGGMKETFATKFENGEVYTKIHVDTPALFVFRKERWAIEQPGILTIDK